MDHELRISTRSKLANIHALAISIGIHALPHKAIHQQVQAVYQRQHKAKQNRDADKLSLAEIESAINDSDFFLRKAIGWALRDYARTNPAWVRSFAETHELSPLSRREALKHLS